MQHASPNMDNDFGFSQRKYLFGSVVDFRHRFRFRRHDSRCNFYIFFLIVEPQQTQSVNEWFDELNIEMKVVNQFTAYFAWELRYVIAYGLADLNE